MTLEMRPIVDSNRRHGFHVREWTPEHIHLTSEHPSTAAPRPDAVPSDGAGQSHDRVR